MPSELEAKLTKCHIFAIHTLVYRFIGFDFLKLAPITVIIILLPYFFIDHLFLMFNFLLPYLLDDFRRFLIPAEWTLDDAVIVHLMFGPLREALKMEGVHAYSSTGGDCITFDDLHMANGAEIVIIILILLLLDDHIFARKAYLHVFQEVRDLVIMDPTIGNDVPQFFIRVGMPEQ